MQSFDCNFRRTRYRCRGGSGPDLGAQGGARFQGCAGGGGGQRLWFSLLLAISLCPLHNSSRSSFKCSGIFIVLHGEPPSPAAVGNIIRIALFVPKHYVPNWIPAYLFFLKQHYLADLNLSCGPL